MRALARGFALLIFLVSLAGCGAKPDAAEAGRAFLEKVRSGAVDEAYNETAFSFQALQTRAAFEANAKEMGLAGMQSFEMSEATVADELTKFDVQVTNRGGVKYPLVMTMQHQSGAWRLYSLRFPRSPETGLSENRFSIVGKGASFGEGSRQPPPNEAEARLLVDKTMRDFQAAIKSGSFDDFYSKISIAWQQQITPKILQRAFQPFIEKGVDLSGIEGKAPMFDNEPFISSDGLLLVTGHYPTEPHRVSFYLKFMYELPEWKLFGIDLNLQK